MRLIDADELEKEYFEVQTKEYGTVYVVTQELIDSLPVITPESVRPSYCPNCGADIRG